MGDKLKDMLKKVRQIEIRTNKHVSDALAGAYHSIFKGRGMDFEEAREYQPGDEIRSIDWNVTARTGKAHVKKIPRRARAYNDDSGGFVGERTVRQRRTF